MNVIIHILSMNLSLSKHNNFLGLHEFNYWGPHLFQVWIVAAAADQVGSGSPQNIVCDIWAMT